MIFAHLSLSKKKCLISKSIKYKNEVVFNAQKVVAIITCIYLFNFLFNFFLA